MTDEVRQELEATLNKLKEVAAKKEQLEESHEPKPESDKSVSPESEKPEPPKNLPTIQEIRDISRKNLKARSAASDALNEPVCPNCKEGLVLGLKNYDFKDQKKGLALRIISLYCGLCRVPISPDQFMITAISDPQEQGRDERRIVDPGGVLPPPMMQ